MKRFPFFFFVASLSFISAAPDPNRPNIERPQSAPATRPGRAAEPRVAPAARPERAAEPRANPAARPEPQGIRRESAPVRGNIERAPERGPVEQRPNREANQQRARESLPNQRASVTTPNGERAARSGAFVRTPSLSRADLQSYRPVTQVPSKLGGNQNLSDLRNRFQPHFQKPGQQAAATESFKNTFRGKRTSNEAASRRVQATIVHIHPHYNRWFSGHFFDQHHYHPPYYGSGSNWWSAPQWGQVAGWGNWGWGYPLYYDGGTATILPPDLYEDQGQPSYQPAPIANQNDWLPLGVFAAGQTVNQAPYSNMFVQLAVDRNGNLAGTYYNAVSDQTYPLSGVVDQSNQQVAWQLTGDPQGPIMTTGMYNLTQDILGVQVYFDNSVEQNWVFVRMAQEQ